MWFAGTWLILTRTVSMNFSSNVYEERQRGHYLWNARFLLFGSWYYTHRLLGPYKDGFPNLIDHQIRKDRGKERTRTQDDHVTFKNRFHHFLTSLLDALDQRYWSHKHDQSCRCSWQCGFLLPPLFHLLKNGMKGQGTITGRIDLVYCMKDRLTTAWCL